MLQTTQCFITKHLVPYYSERALTIFSRSSTFLATLTTLSILSTNLPAAQNISWDDDVADLNAVNLETKQSPELSADFLKIRQFKWENSNYRRLIVSREQNLLMNPAMIAEVAKPIVFKADYEDLKLTDPVLFFKWEIKNANAENSNAESVLDESQQVTHSSLLKTQIDKPGNFKVTLSIQNSAGRVLTQNWNLKVGNPKTNLLSEQKLTLIEGQITHKT